MMLARRTRRHYGDAFIERHDKAGSAEGDEFGDGRIAPLAAKPFCPSCNTMLGTIQLAPCASCRPTSDASAVSPSHSIHADESTTRISSDHCDHDTR
jgi:hypothetical protein